jgi:hypothetical protein
LVQWNFSLTTYCAPIWDKPVDALGVVEVLSVLAPVRTRIPETGSRLRGRIEMIFDFAKARNWRAGENPAQWKGNLAHLLSRRPKLARVHFASMLTKICRASCGSCEIG